VIEVADELVTQCQKGDPEAFDKLVSLTQNSVFNIAFRILGNREDAQDTSQLVYLRLWQGLPTFRNESKFTTWLYRIVVNTCLNRQRQMRRQLQIIDDEGLLDMMPERHCEPLDAAIQNERNMRIWQAVDSLDSKYRLVISLFYQEELSYTEIADLLMLPVGTVKAHLNRARVALAKLLLNTNGE